MPGAPTTTVARCRRHRGERLAGVEAISEHGGRADVEGDAEPGVQAEDVEQRQRHEHDVVGVTIGGSTAAPCARLASSARAESIAPLGRPLVPLV